MEVVVPVVLGCVALAMLSAMNDVFVKFLEFAMELTPKMPNYFHKTVRYLVSVIVSGFVCWQLDFKIFDYLGLNARWEFFGWFITALLVACGSQTVRKSFDISNEVPSLLRGITTSIQRFTTPVKENGKKDSQKDDYDKKV